jgi:hypothetical protein
MPSAEDLGVRGDAEIRLRIDGRRLAKLAHAVALRHYDFAVFDDGEGEAGDVELLQHASNVGVEIGGCLRVWSSDEENGDSNREEERENAARHGR